MDDRTESASGADSTTTGIDPELDIRSDKFNPLKALLTEEKLVLHKNAPIYDNVSVFESRMKRANLRTTQNETTTETQRYEWMPCIAAQATELNLNNEIARFGI